MADYIEIDTSALMQDRQTIKSELYQVRAGIDQLREKMVNLGSMWEGPAHQTFLTQFQADYEFMVDFCKELEEYVRTMEFAQKEYERCDSQVRQAISSIRI